MGLYAAQELQLEEVLTQAIGAPVAGAHAAETGMAAKRHKHLCIHHLTKTNNTQGGGRESQSKWKTLISV